MSWPSAPRSFSRPPWARQQAELDVTLRAVHAAARRLTGATTHGDPVERQRLIDRIARDQHAKPRWAWEPVAVARETWLQLKRARALAVGSPAADLYLERLEELETELILLESLGHGKRVRPMAARLFGTGAERLFEGRATTVLDAAHEILAREPVEREARSIPATSRTGVNLRDLMLAYARHVGLQIAVRVEPRLVANAAVGERTVFIADRLFGAREAQRLATHEVYGHMVSAFNGRAQTLGIFSVGTASSFGDQEGVAIFLEELAGQLDPQRKRTLAGRALATHAMHAGVSFGDAARALVREQGFSPAESVTLCERAFRAGGVARDAVYLSGWLRVRHSVEMREASLAELQVGKISFGALAQIRQLAAEGLVQPPTYLSNLAKSRARTAAGTSSATSPPSLTTSFTRVDAT